MDDNTITLVSTHTIDLVPETGRVPRETPGGPAHYIGTTLERLGCPYHLITGVRPRVHVLQTSEGEQYVIPHIPFIELPPRLFGRATILSPVMREIDPTGVPPVAGLLVVDLQGFVREPNVPTAEVTGTFELAELLSRANVVKAGHSEMRLLSKSSREALSATIILETQGMNGVLVHMDGKTQHIAAHAIDTPDTIGAGDTFLAGFVANITEGLSAVEAATRAARLTERILKSRMRHQTAGPL